MPIDEPKLPKQMDPINPHSLLQIDRWLLRTLFTAIVISLFSLMLTIFARGDLSFTIGIVSGGVGLIAGLVASLYFAVSAKWDKLLLVLVSSFLFGYMMLLLLKAGMASH